MCKVPSMPLLSIHTFVVFFSLIADYDDPDQPVWLLKLTWAFTVWSLHMPATFSHGAAQLLYFSTRIGRGQLAGSINNA